MKVLPVLDLLNDRVVHAVAGERETYAPISSRLGEQGDAQTIAANLAEQYGFTHAYVADLNALAGAEPNWRAITAIRSKLPNLWIDAGVNHIDRIAKFETAAPILSLESLESESQARNAIGRCGDIVFSIDMKNGRLMTRVEAWKDMAPEAMFDQAVQWGVRRVIPLELSSVGGNTGPSLLPMISTLHARHPDVTIISGGGIKHIGDLSVLEAAGCSLALVATGLHFGDLQPHQLPERFIG